MVPYETLLTSSNAYEIFDGYKIVVDCSDNVATRYLINDTCVLTGKPLVSGSALGWEGQLTVYNNGPVMLLLLLCRSQNRSKPVLGCFRRSHYSRQL